MEKSIEDIQKALAAPFIKVVGKKTYPDHKWLPKDGKSMKEKIICMPYLSGNQIRDRLNDVLGLDGWMFDSRLETDGTRTASLSILVNGNWIQRDGTGTQSNTEKEKGAETDALKRAARNFGIGSYIDQIPQHFQKAKANANGKLAPVDNNGRWLYGNNLNNFINGYSSVMGHLHQILVMDNSLWSMPEFQVLYNKFNK